MNDHDKGILRDLAKQYAEICARPVQDERRVLWRQHNSLKQTRPLIYVRAFAWQEMPESKCLCEEPFARQHEGAFRNLLFWNSLGDDSIFEPWTTVQATRKCGGWGICAHQNQAMPYAEELDDPAANVNNVKRSQLWGYMAAQELTAVSPAMHDEFILKYQLPILNEFGLVAYGCCEDLTNKIDMLRQIQNLRRIAVSPFADVPRCAEQIGRDYVFSYRPSPADMVSYGLDKERVRSILTKDLKACRDCHVDITLKDVETVEKDPERVKNWVAITRKAIDEVFG